MSIRDIVAAGKADTTGMVDRQAHGKPVKLRVELSAGELLTLAAAPVERRPALQVLWCLHDEKGQPLFSALAEVLALKWDLLRPLLELTREVRGLDLKEAEKN